MGASVPFWHGSAAAFVHKNELQAATAPAGGLDRLPETVDRGYAGIVNSNG
jgi:hypothetical protein